jgi:hypothetical protein
MVFPRLVKRPEIYLIPFRPWIRQKFDATECVLCSGWEPDPVAWQMPRHRNQAKDALSSDG